MRSLRVWVLVFAICFSELWVGVWCTIALVVFVGYVSFGYPGWFGLWVRYSVFGWFRCISLLWFRQFGWVSGLFTVLFVVGGVLHDFVVSCSVWVVGCVVRCSDFVLLVEPF